MSLLLAIIYMAFISLGLPDALLGSAWPEMREQMNIPVSYAGIISMIISTGTILSSLLSDRLTKILGTGKVTAVSVAVTALALLGFSVSPSFLWLCAIALPYGLGAGAVDAVLNNYVALHFKARHMNWLHCFWGVGATVGPYIMGVCFTGGLAWNSGYRIISYIQMALTVALFLTLPLWKGSVAEEQPVRGHRNIKLSELLKLSGAKSALVSFFCYCSLEQTAGLWGASYMVMSRGMSPETAAKWASLFYLGIMVGRFLSGFITMKLNDQNMIRLGQVMIGIGMVLLILPLSNTILSIGFIMIGLGCAPVFPGLLHETPVNFDSNLSQAVMGVQMAFAYLGTTLMPPLFGILAEFMGIQFYPLYLLALFILMTVAVEHLNKLPKYHFIEEE